MFPKSLVRGIVLLLAAGLAGPQPLGVRADVTAPQVRQAIDRGVQFLLRQQRADGSWADLINSYPNGVTALATLALLNAGVEPDSPAIQKALAVLRRRPAGPRYTYVVALETMVFAAASPVEDRQRIRENVDWLERTQNRGTINTGMWSYTQDNRRGGDNSNTQFAMLALRDAEEAGVSVSQNTWRLAERHWRTNQGERGGWGYKETGSKARARGSMTVAGIASMIIARGRLHDGKEEIRDGKAVNCGAFGEDPTLETAYDWLGRNFSVTRNPGHGVWTLYYLYGLERAGRLSGRRFFGKHDWYREGAEQLVAAQDGLLGSWRGGGHIEANTSIGTSFALLFLSKGLAPVAVNKLMHGPGNDWNNDRNDIRHLTRATSRTPGWPRLLTWQVIDPSLATVEDLLQAPVCFFNGHEAPEFDEDQIQLLRDYVSQGGFLFAEACCSREEFDEGFRRLIQRMYPEAEYQLKPLSADHPVWRAQYLIDPAASPTLWGVELGCRTSIIYCPEDLSCFWEQASLREKPDAELASMVQKALSLGINVLAYATGKELQDRLAVPNVIRDEPGSDRIQRDFLEIARIRHGGNWNAAPMALRNLLVALRDLVNMNVVSKSPDLPVLDERLFDYPLVYMHGRSAFSFSPQETDQLREYLVNGGTLFADATCGAETFGQSFRALMHDLFPDRELERIPPTHPMFTEEIGMNLQRVRRREPERAGPNEPLRPVEKTVEPFLEGIQIDNRYAVIFSKYDISCALERHTSVDCRGYVRDDAVRLAVNVVLYSLLQ